MKQESQEFLLSLLEEQKDKELLLKDLTARLNTNLVCSIYRTDDESVGYRDEILHGYCKGDIWYEFYFREDCCIFIQDVSKIKPYLFPLSSMTEEQKLYLEWHTKYRLDDGELVVKRDEDDEYLNTNIYDYLSLIEWLNKNHFDYQGLIERGLAIDCTNLKIY